MHSLSKNYNNNKDSLVNYLKSNLSYLIKKYNIDNEVLSKCTGIASSTIASLRSRPGNPTILTLHALADFFNVTVDQLISQDCSLLDEVGNSAGGGDDINNIIRVPVIDICDAMKWPFDVQKLYPDEPDADDCKLRYITTNNDINNLCYAVKLDSEVLKPYYMKNTMFIIDPDKQPLDGNIVLIDLHNTNNLTFRRVFIDSGDYYFKPVNPEFGSMQTYDKCKIYGVVIRALQDL